MDDSKRSIITTYKNMLPAVLLLSIFILVHNSVILKDYYPDRRKLVTSIFMIIATCDMFTAFGSVFNAVPAIKCILNPTALQASWLDGLYFPVERTCYICSVYITVVLSVTKTINIKDPFLKINKCSVYVVLLIGTCFWMVINTVDFIRGMSNWPHNSSNCSVQWDKMLNVSSNYNIPWMGVVQWQILAYILPSLVVLVCMVIQMYCIKKSLSRETAENSRETAEISRETTALLADVKHINGTVFLVSMLFIVCTLLNAPAIVFSFLSNAKNDKQVSTEKWQDENLPKIITFVVLQHTIPLINAAVYPLIIILRKPSLRQKYSDRVITLLRCPVTYWHRIGCPARRSQV